MITMKPIIRFLLILILLLLGTVSAIYGIQWITVYHGLNPYIAFPISTCCFIFVGWNACKLHASWVAHVAAFDRWQHNPRW